MENYKDILIEFERWLRGEIANAKASNQNYQFQIATITQLEYVHQALQEIKKNHGV